MATTASTTIPTTLRARVMARAWEIFRKRYNYPRVPFRSIGRACFACSLRAAWDEARETVRLAAHGVEVLKATIENLIEEPHRVGLSTSYSLYGAALVAHHDRIRTVTRAMEFAQAA